MKRTGQERKSPRATRDSQRSLALGDLYLNTAEHSLSRGNKNIRLTPKLCALLQIFMTNRGKVLTRQSLIEEVWETSYMGDTRTLDVHIHWLRKALGDNAWDPVYPTLSEEWGIGSRFRIGSSLASTI